MELIVPIDERTRRRIDLIMSRDSSYFSLDDFVVRAILNQLTLEESRSARSGSSMEARLASQVTLDAAPRWRAMSPKQLQVSQTTSSSAAVEVPRLDPRRLAQLNDSGDLMVLPPEVDARDRGIPLWGQISRFAPGIFSLRILGNLAREKGAAWVDLESATGVVSDQAVAARAALVENDEVNERERGYQLSTGFPQPDKVSKHRFTNQYLGYLAPRAGRPQGLLSELCFVNMRKVESGRVEIGVTERGRKFANLTSPLVDSALISKGSPETGLSKEEVEFLTAHLKDSRPGELEFLRFVVKSVAEGSGTPSALLEATERYLTEIAVMPTLTPAIVSTMRAGAVSKLVEFGVVAISKEGARSHYSLKEEGATLLGG